ncbi:hypothetical protein GCM10009780_30930 [Actinomadura alba]
MTAVTIGAGVTSWQAHARNARPARIRHTSSLPGQAGLAFASGDSPLISGPFGTNNLTEEAGKPVGANDTLRDRVAVLEGRANDHDALHRRLEFKIDNLTDEVAFIKTDVEGLKDDVGVLKADMSEVKGKIGILTDDVAELKARTADLGEIRARVAEIPEIKASQIKIQNMVAKLLAKAEGTEEAASVS